MRYRTSGPYFARLHVGGKLFRERLKTGVFTVAKLRLADFTKEKRSEFGVETLVDAGIAPCLRQPSCRLSVDVSSPHVTRDRNRAW